MDGDEDERIARMLQEQFDREATSYQAADDHTIDSDNEIPLSVTAPLPEDGEEWRLQACLDDEAFARLLQEDFDGEAAERVGDGDDPLPDLHTLFLNFDEQFFEGKLKGVEVRWSPRMTLCAGMCYYYKGGYCSVRLSEPLLKLRPKSDYINTLLHEMIHAYLFITQRNTDRDGHGPAFLDLAKRINDSEGTKITVYHNFRDEVNHYRTHVWKCQGTCGRLLKRAMNRPPRPTDWWWSDHQAKCGGDYIKISSPPENSKAKKGKGKTDKTEKKSTHATIEDEQVALRKIEKAKEGGPKRKRPPDTEPDNVKKEKTSSDDDPTKAIPTQISTSDVQITHPELLARRLNRFQTSTSSFSKPLISIIDDKRLEKPNEAFRAFVVLTDDEEEVKMEGKAPRSPSVSSTTSSHKPSIPASSPIPVDAKPLVSLPTQPLSSLASESTFSAPTISAGPSREIKQFGGISPPPLNNLPSIVPRPKSPITAFPPQRPQTGTPKLVQCPCCGRLVRASEINEHLDQCLS